MPTRVVRAGPVGAASRHERRLARRRHHQRASVDQGGGLKLRSTSRSSCSATRQGATRSPRTLSTCARRFAGSFSPRAGTPTRDTISCVRGFEELHEFESVRAVEACHAAELGGSISRRVQVAPPSRRRSKAPEWTAMVTGPFSSQTTPVKSAGPYSSTEGAAVGSERSARDRPAT